MNTTLARRMRLVAAFCVTVALLLASPTWSPSPSPASSRTPTAGSFFASASAAVASGDAWARPGGGESYSGGSSSRSSGSSSSSGGDSDGVLNLIVFLVFEVPALGIPLLLAFVAYMIYSRMRASRQDWSTARAPMHDDDDGHAHHQPRGPAPRTVLEGLRGEDENFSLVLFEDFLAFLYSQVHEARGRNAIDELAPYVADPVRAMLRAPRGLRQVKGIALGSMRFVDARLADAQTIVRVEFEANVTEVSDAGEHAFYVVETWTLVRRRGARSREPKNARTLGCPNCGAPRTALRGTRCSQCNGIVGDGAFDWNLSALELQKRESRPPLLTGTVQEQGTDLPTIVEPGANTAFARLQQKDPQVAWPGLQARVGLAFGELQVAWSSQDLTRARPFVTDALFQSLFYWVDTYRRSGLRNVTEQTTLTNMVLARVTSDRFYDAVTIRIYASGLDYTLDGSGRVVAGNRNETRAYSEYWTLIRGSQRRGPSRAEPVCPNCGAPLAVNMAGTCTYCNVIVTTGEFDWVVSRMEQDEAYSG